MFDSTTAKKALHEVRLRMEENRDRLIEMDSIMGDGDLGLTMAKAFVAADDQLATSTETDVGTIFALAGMAMAKAAPSTMGTLVATGFMRGGKALKGKSQLAAADVAAFFRAFAEGIVERGRTQPGNKTILDVMDPVALALEQAAAGGAALGSLPETARVAAAEGWEAAKMMMSQHGKAAIYREQTVGKPDPGATAGVLIVEGFVAAIG